MLNTEQKIPLVVVVIVAWNNKDLLAECIESIQTQTYKNVKIVLVDNNSSDNTVKFLEANYHDKVNLIKSSENTGFSKGNNIGIKAAYRIYPNLEYIVLLNTDARLEINWTEQMVDFALKKPLGALFQGTTLDYYDKNIIDSTHIYLARNGQGTQANWRMPYLGEMGPMRVFGVNAAACMISSAFITNQPFENLFDEKFFMYLEDVDLSMRATVMGWDNYLVPNARAYHMGSASSGKNPGFSLYMTFRNNSALIVKNLSIKMLLKILPDLIRSDIDTIRHLHRTGRNAAARKVIKGRFVGILRVLLFLKSIHVMRKVRNIDDKYLFELMNKGH